MHGKGQNSTHRHTKTPKPIFTKIGMRDYVLDGTRHAKFCSDRFMGFCSPNIYVILPCFWGDYNVRFFGASIRLQPTPLDGYLRKILQMTSFRVRKCLLGAPMTIGAFKYPKTAISGTDFWRLVFFRPKTALTWGCSNINVNRHRSRIKVL